MSNFFEPGIESLQEWAHEDFNLSNKTFISLTSRPSKLFPHLNIKSDIKQPFKNILSFKILIERNFFRYRDAFHTKGNIILVALHWLQLIVNNFTITYVFFFNMPIWWLFCLSAPKLIKFLRAPLNYFCMPLFFWPHCMFCYNRVLGTLLAKMFVQFFRAIIAP